MCSKATQLACPAKAMFRLAPIALLAMFWVCTENIATITNSTFTGNTGTALSTPGNTTITGSSFTNNSGSQAGAILSAKPTFSTSTLTISSSTFTGNTSTGYGGAIYSSFNNLF